MGGLMGASRALVAAGGGGGLAGGGGGGHVRHPADCGTVVVFVVGGVSPAELREVRGGDEGARGSFRRRMSKKEVREGPSFPSRGKRCEEVAGNRGPCGWGLGTRKGPMAWSGRVEWSTGKSHAHTHVVVLATTWLETPETHVKECRAWCVPYSVQNPTS